MFCPVYFAVKTQSAYYAGIYVKPILIITHIAADFVGRFLSVVVDTSPGELCILYAMCLI